MLFPPQPIHRFNVLVDVELELVPEETQDLLITFLRGLNVPRLATVTFLYAVDPDVVLAYVVGIKALRSVGQQVPL